mmetsp:Transcript_6325/g.804  ORF Transcript_6325/g.804 Transcript_6325/m.804 type:complete len:139 (+) Transcript_6325:9555-9971(+)
MSAFEQLKNISPALLRVPKPQGSEPFIAFEVVFKGENVVGEAGPYRQFFADLSNELLSDNSGNGIIIKAPNYRDTHVEGIETYIINPSRTSALDLQIYEFLGILFGCCARTGSKLALNLPAMFWKPLVGEFLTYEDLS